MASLFFGTDVPVEEPPTASYAEVNERYSITSSAVARARRNLQPNCLRSPKIQGKVELGRLLHGQFGRRSLP